MMQSSTGTNSASTPAPGGSNQTPPGGTATNDSSPESNQPTNDVVSYDTHRRLLAEKKKRDEENAALRSRLDAIEAANREREEAELKAKEDYKKLVELREKELTEVRAKLDQKERIFTEAKKLDHFTRALGTSIQPQYLGLVNTDEILLDPATGAVDEPSVARAVENFRQRYPEIIPTRHGALPAGAPIGNGGGLTYEQWLKLPVDEMRKRRKDVIEA